MAYGGGVWGDCPDGLLDYSGSHPQHINQLEAKPMKDIDKLKQLLDSWGVPYKIDDDGDVRVGHFWDSARDHPKVNGYDGFFTAFEFDDDGNFLRMGAWE